MFAIMYACMCVCLYKVYKTHLLVVILTIMYSRLIMYFSHLQIENRGGKCIPVACDHTNDAEVKALFDRVKQEQDCRLDLLVNNAYAAVDVSYNLSLSLDL